MLLSVFQTSGMLFAVSILELCFLALGHSLMSKSPQKPRRRKSELTELCRNELPITTTAAVFLK